MLRILHVNKLFRPDFAGEAVFIERLVPVMDVFDHTIRHDVLAVKTKGSPPLFTNCTAIDRLFYLGIEDGNNIRGQFRILWFLIRHMCQYKILHYHSHVDRYFVATLLYKLCGRKVIYTATLEDSAEGLIGGYSPPWRKFIAKAVRLFDAYICISPRLYDQTVTIVGPERARHIPIGIHIPSIRETDRAAKRTELGLDPSLPVAIFVGGICRRKDPLLLVMAVAGLKAVGKKVSLILVGPVLEPDYAESLFDIVKTNDLQGQVKFVGFRDNPNEYFAIADVMAFASHSEGFGTVVIEAMAMGLPVIARRLRGVNEDFVIEGETGHLFDQDSQFMPLLEGLISDPRRGHEMGLKARAHVAKMYGMDGVAQQYLNAYRASPKAATTGWSTIDEPRRGFLNGGATCSIIDPRVREPAALPQLGGPIVLTTIDAEEEFDWSQPMRSGAGAVSNIAHQSLGQAIFERHGVRPMYLITYPVADQTESWRLLRSWLEEGRCEIGAQLHPWVTPPFEETVSIFNSYLGNLDIRLQFEKILSLTRAIERNFGIRPTAFRSGRYGVGARLGDMLRTLGYRIDLSVVPYFDYSAEGGPAFWKLPDQPYWCDGANDLLEIPITTGIVGTYRNCDPRLLSTIFGSPSQKLHVPSLLARTGLIERIRLTPEGTGFEDCKRLLISRIEAGQRVFVLSYHSPSLVPGNTPYVQNAEDLKRFLGWLDSFYAFFLGELGGRAMMLSEFYNSARKAASRRSDPLT